MKKTLVTAIALGLALLASPVLAHHPAEDMVDADIYAMIDELVADTPHATLVFDDDMGSGSGSGSGSGMGMDDGGTTTITVPSVSDAEDLVDQYLLAALSLLDEEVTVSITFGEDVEPVSTEALEDESWVERDDWGRQVIITIDTLLCIPADEFVPGEDPDRAQCIDIKPDEAP